MKIVVIADAALKDELLFQGTREEAEIYWLEYPAQVDGATAYIDLLFQPSEERINQLKQLQPATIIVNAVNSTTSELGKNLIRINGWQSFLKRPVVEAAAAADNRTIAEQVFSQFNKTVEWVPDVPGFITARVISMVINEAWFAWEEQVSSREEIDTAMKLGTNYPLGPFEWGDQIGLANIYQLLKSLSAKDIRYQPAAILQKQAGA
jgi:3-hydroxybutyryl-CoA dehydrogenase